MTEKMISPEIRKKLHAYFIGKRDEMSDALCNLVRIPSVRGEALPEKPFGEECDRVLVAVLDLWRKNGMVPTDSRSEGYVFADIIGESVGQRKTIGLFAHADVVPPNGEWILTQPFEPIKRDGFLIGRGVSDDKGGIIGILYAVKALHECGIPIQNDIRLFVGAAEETGMDEIRTYVGKYGSPDVTIVPDSGNPLSFGERSHIRFTASSVPSVILSLSGVQHHAQAVLPDNISLADCPDGITVETNHATTVHSQKDGTNAILLLCDYLRSCPSLAADKPILDSISDICRSRDGSTYDIHDTDKIFGGCQNIFISLTTEQGQIQLTMLFRFPPTLRNDFSARLSSAIHAKNMQYTEVSTHTAYLHTMDDPIVGMITDSYCEVTGKTEWKPFLSGGGTYARYLSDGYAIGSNVSEENPFHLPSGHGHAHVPDECISADGLFTAAEIIALDILKLDRYS